MQTDYIHRVVYLITNSVTRVSTNIKIYRNKSVPVNMNHFNKIRENIVNKIIK